MYSTSYNILNKSHNTLQNKKALAVIIAVFILLTVIFILTKASVIRLSAFTTSVSGWCTLSRASVAPFLKEQDCNQKAIHTVSFNSSYVLFSIFFCLLLTSYGTMFTSAHDLNLYSPHSEACLTRRRIQFGHTRSSGTVSS